MWKDKQSILEPDIRFLNMVAGNADGTMIRPFEIGDLYDLVAPLKLAETVPEELRGQFDLARCVFVYSWFAYEMATMAEQHVLTVVEAAIKHRAKIENSGLKDHPGLRKAIKHAIEHGWLLEDEFRLNVKLTALDIMVMTRNDLMHGNPHLLPQGSLEMLRLAHKVISNLFP